VLWKENLKNMLKLTHLSRPSQDIMMVCWYNYAKRVILFEQDNILLKTPYNILNHSGLLTFSFGIYAWYVSDIHSCLSAKLVVQVLWGKSIFSGKSSSVIKEN